MVLIELPHPRTRWTYNIAAFCQDLSSPHLHVMLTALAGVPCSFMFPLCPIGKITSIDDAKRVIENKVHDIGQQGWAVGYGYDPSRVHDHLDLTRTWLDDISRQVPIFILNQSEHLAYANSKAFEKANIHVETANPKFFPQKDGNFTGIILEDGIKMVSLA